MFFALSLICVARPFSYADDQDPTGVDEDPTYPTFKLEMSLNSTVIKLYMKPNNKNQTTYSFVMLKPRLYHYLSLYLPRVALTTWMLSNATSFSKLSNKVL